MKAHRWESCFVSGNIRSTLEWRSSQKMFCFALLNQQIIFGGSHRKKFRSVLSIKKRLLQCVLNAWLPCCVIVGYDGGRTTLHKNILAPCKYHSICFLECSDLQEWSYTRFNEENHNEETRHLLSHFSAPPKIKLCY